MRKIISGLFFRAVRSIEFWLIFAVAGLYLFFFYRNNKDALFSYDERIYSDLRILVTVMPLLLITIFTTIFFGRLFSDHTIRNLIASGHSKKTTYITSALFSVITTTLLDTAVITPIIVCMKITKWENRIGWPTIICILATSYLIHLVFTMMILMIIYLTGKQIITLVAGMLIFAAIIGGVSAAPLYALMQPERMIEASLISKYRDLHPDSEITMDWEIDLTDMEDNITVYENGEVMDMSKISRPNPRHITGMKRHILKAILLYNPAPSIMMELAYPPKDLYEQGAYRIFFISEGVWALIFAAAGTILFNRKELN